MGAGVDVDDELPILGEPLAVELANTRYGEGSRWATDFLGDPRLAVRWVEASGLMASAGLTPQLLVSGSSRVALAATLRPVRDAVRDALVAFVDGSEPGASAVAALNAAAAAAPHHRALVLDGAALRCERRWAAGGVARLVAHAAELAMEFLAGPDVGRVRRCPAPDCTMLFVAAHHRRKFCHPSCSHRARQAAYYRRLKRAATEGGGR